VHPVALPGRPRRAADAAEGVARIARRPAEAPVAADALAHLGPPRAPDDVVVAHEAGVGEQARPEVLQLAGARPAHAHRGGLAAVPVVARIVRVAAGAAVGARADREVA